MKCRFKAPKGNNYLVNQIMDTAAEVFSICFTLAMWDEGFEDEEMIKRLVNRAVGKADDFTRGDVTLEDMKRVLVEEANLRASSKGVE